MIDNYTGAMKLIEKIKEHLPLFARPTKEFIQAMKDNEIEVTKDQDLQIDSALYMGDEGGIGCSLVLSKESGRVIVVSITHIQIKPGHPLAVEIENYQKKRIRKLSKRQW